jgi:hypothetical protein
MGQSSAFIDAELSTGERAVSGRSAQRILHVLRTIAGTARRNRRAAEEYIYRDRDPLVFGEGAPRRWGRPEFGLGPMQYPSPGPIAAPETETTSSEAPSTPPASPSTPPARPARSPIITRW